MALLNSYATLEEFLAQPDITSGKPVDDVFIEDLLSRSSREFDGDTGHWFYSDTQTRRYDVPRGYCLKLDAPLLSVTSLTNGDGTAIAATEYDLTPFNGVHHTAIELHEDATTLWLMNGARVRGVIYVAGAWGYVDRTATDPASAVAIYNSKTAVLALALALYRKRYGVSVEGAATITGAGVVITPRDKSPEYWALVQVYRRLL